MENKASVSVSDVFRFLFFLGVVAVIAILFIKASVNEPLIPAIVLFFLYYHFSKDLE